MRDVLPLKHVFRVMWHL